MNKLVVVLGFISIAVIAFVAGRQWDSTDQEPVLSDRRITDTLYTSTRVMHDGEMYDTSEFRWSIDISKGVWIIIVRYDWEQYWEAKDIFWDLKRD